MHLSGKITRVQIHQQKDTYLSHLYMLSPWSHSLTVNWFKHSSNEAASPWISTVKSIIFSNWFETFLHFVHITWERFNKHIKADYSTWLKNTCITGNWHVTDWDLLENSSQNPADLKGFSILTKCHHVLYIQHADAFNKFELYIEDLPVTGGGHQIYVG